MKVCLITSTYPTSEADKNVPFLVESVRHLVARGADVEIFAPAYEGSPAHVLHGVNVHRFRYFLRRWENLTHNQGAPNRIRNPLYLVVAFFYILFGLVQAVLLGRRRSVDLIHVHWPFPHGIWGYAMSRASGAPIVLTFHGAELLLSKRFPFVRPFLKHAIRHAQVLFCNSRFTAGEIAKLTDKPVVIAPYGCTVRPAKLPASRPVRDHAHILFVGRLIRRKGVGYLIQAMELLRQARPVHLHIVGNGDQRETWMELTRTLGLDDCITFHGTLPDAALVKQYATADVFVLPAIIDERGDTEGLGVVLVEALAFNLPVVASDVGGIPDVIIHERTGLLVPEKDPAALAQAILRMLTDQPLAERCAHNGFQHAHEYFDWQRITDLVLKGYAEALHRTLDRPIHTHTETPLSPILAPNGRELRVPERQVTQGLSQP